MNVKPLAIPRIISSHPNSPARRITLPIDWTRAHGDPKFVNIIAGNILIISSHDEEALAVEAATCLMQAGIMRPLTNGKGEVT